jgi:hypothetical protein
MTPETIKYIEACANERENASVQKLSCADVRALLAERAVLLEALRRLSRSCDGDALGTTQPPKWQVLCAAETAIKRAAS